MIVSFLALLISLNTASSSLSFCASKTNDKYQRLSIDDTVEAHFGHPDSLLFDPYLSHAFFEAQMYYKPSFNEKYVALRKIKTIHLKMFTNRNGAWKDYESMRSFEFNEAGKLIGSNNYFTSGGELDTLFTAKFIYKGEGIYKNSVGFQAPPNESHYYNYQYDENKLTETEYEKGFARAFTIYEFQNNALYDKNLSSVKQYVLDTLRAVTIFREGKIDDAAKILVSKEWAEKIKSPVYLMLHVVETNNGLPAYRVRLDTNGTALKIDEDFWTYNGDGKLVSRSATTLSGYPVTDRFMYDISGLIKAAIWKDQYKMEATYTFY